MHKCSMLQVCILPILAKGPLRGPARPDGLPRGRGVKGLETLRSTASATNYIEGQMDVFDRGTDGQFL